MMACKKDQAQPSHETLDQIFEKIINEIKVDETGRGKTSTQAADRRSVSIDFN
ncbi:MAG: hypothetical protein F6K55_03110 [Moorea sp. SIO4A3]|nr:hypothetical protein [Moorena sp. SIO4A3]